MSLKGTKRARGEEPGTSKRRRTEVEDALWQLRPVSDLKMSSIYNRSASEAPAELFRKDLISAMKLPDSEPLTSAEYWIITDTWKQEWERGVQVPVNPDSLPAPKVKIIDNPLPPDFTEFKLPRDRYIHLNRDAFYDPTKHLLSSTPARAEASCAYDMDATDLAWLKTLNAERARAGASPVSEDKFERVIEELEVRTWTKIQSIVKSEEGVGIEYDENVICDVCRSPDSEDGNEMVFCDLCNICVHQACYGITVIPAGQWLCRPCGDRVKPSCVLCPNTGGAMKCTPSGHKWAHVSCVLWIPEVSIGCAEKMEPITKISSIPASRWSLVCVLCRERKGACIQCSVKTCKTAYHVTCAFKHGLEMRAIIEDESADDGVKLRSYCQKHSVNSKKEQKAIECKNSGSEEEEDKKRKRRKDMTSEEKNQARQARLQEIERDFDRHVNVKDISTHLLDIDEEAVSAIYNYWKLKRRAFSNRPLLPPKSDDSEILSHRQEQADLDRMKMFVQLRQDLERVRNLCYMVSRREKLSRSFFRMREQTFHKQVAVLSADIDISGLDLQAIIEANHGPSIYDRLYSHPDAPDHQNDFDTLLARIAPPDSDDDKKKDRNGILKGNKSGNPYRRHYVNGSRRSASIYSEMSSEESAPEIIRSARFKGRSIGSSTDDDKKPPLLPKKKVSYKTKGKRSPKKIEKKKKMPLSKAIVESSSEEDIKDRIKQDRSRSKTLQQMEKEMAATINDQSATDSDDIITITKSTRNSKFPIDIYSDSSDESVKHDTKGKNKNDFEKNKSEKVKRSKSSNEDSPQPFPRTKGAMKEFILTQPEKVVKDESTPKKRGRKPSDKDKTTPIKIDSDDEAKNKENVKFLKQDPTDLIVPQRQAAKKASENMRSTIVVKKDEPADQKAILSGDDTKPKIKTKTKTDKEVVPAKVARKKSSAKEVEKEPIAYVPQRQAAKKAAAHIKSGLGAKPPIIIDNIDLSDSKKELESKTPVMKEDSKSSTNDAKETSSSSSSGSSSSSYSSSSSSDEEEQTEKPEVRPANKAREIKPLQRDPNPPTRHPSMFSPPGARPTVDLPFLDKVSRPLSSTSASSDSDTSRGSRSCSSSISPTPRRPRRRRKKKSISTDGKSSAIDRSNSTDAKTVTVDSKIISPQKTPDKKLKTSERGSECRLPSPTPQREESCRSGDTRAATRARTRSTASSGNMSHQLDARQRKSSKEDILTSAPHETAKKSSQPSQLSTQEWKTDEIVKRSFKEDLFACAARSDVKGKIKRRSDSFEEKDELKSLESIISPKTSPKKSAELKYVVSPKTSPRKSAELKYKTPRRHMSVKDTSPKVTGPVHTEHRESITNEKRMSKHNNDRPSKSPIKNPSVEPKAEADEVVITKSNDDKSLVSDSSEKHWLPKVHPPPIEKAGGHEKYMTEENPDCADKSSIKMIAKIQATLNENLMIRSPKTPMDARTMDQIDIDNPIVKNVHKQSTVDADKKYINQDASHVQGVEISKSAKIPSNVNPYPNRSMFSPEAKNSELYEFDMMRVEQSFNHDDMTKPFATYPEFFFKEDSKEQGVQETLDLVGRLRMQLSTKKAESTQDESTTGNEDQSVKDEDHSVKDEDQSVKDEDQSVKDVDHSAVPNLVSTNLDNQLPDNTETPVAFKKSSPSKIVYHPVNNDPRPVTPTGPTFDDKMYRPLQSLPLDDKWPELPPTPHMPLEHHSEIRRQYEYMAPLHEEFRDREQSNSQVDIISVSGDTVSKQSDDSQSQSLSVTEHSQQSGGPDPNSYDNNNSQIHSDCATIASPYGGHDKWHESKIATRRSSASSTDSEGSVCSRKAEQHKRDEQLPRRLDIDPYNMPAYVDPPLPMGRFAGYARDASPFMSLPLPPPLYAPPLHFTPSSMLQPLPKPAFSMCAAFTSSSQNIALTTAMIAPPTPKPADSPRYDADVNADKYAAPSPSISVSNDSYSEHSMRAPVSASPTPVPAPSSAASHDSHDVQLLDSKSKSTKFPGKSPGKSPAGISPKQSDKASKRTSNKSNRNQRGRGRSKSRARNYPSTDYMGNSIQSKLVGTVYDFDDEIANDGVDLKALRERRKSIDIRDDRKSENSCASQSPRVLSSPQSKKQVPLESKELKSATSEPKESTSSAGKPGTPGFVPVIPLLPGPVDMRTYQPPESGASAVPAPTPVSTDPAGYHRNLLATFASGTADQQLPDIDEEQEKQLHSALMCSTPGAPPAVPSQPAPQPSPQPTPPVLPKVSSLFDPRNQLKVKIKGPFLDANYSASSVASTAPQPPPPALSHVLDTPPNFAAPSASSFIGGSTNLRRMRKKELLRQYWTQDMNMEDVVAAPPPVAPPPIARAGITIPKAVASMTSIPTRDDYDLPEEKKKKRKTTSGLSRELRHLEVSMNDDVEPAEVKIAPAAKRRGRTTTKPSRELSPPTTPKLKIKLGANTVHAVNDDRVSFHRPPKKRIVVTAPKPSLEDLRRESMKYRRQVMADFEEHEKPKKSSKSEKTPKSVKRKKKKEKKADKADKLQVMVNSSGSENATKLVIKIKQIKLPKDQETTGEHNAALAAAAAAPEPPVDPFEYDPSATDPLAIDPPSYSGSSSMRKVRTAKVTPIRLKLSRSLQGEGYVMKDSGAPAVPTATDLLPPTLAASSAPSVSSATATSVPSTVPAPKPCDVR